MTTVNYDPDTTPWYSEGLLSSPDQNVNNSESPSLLSYTNILDDNRGGVEDDALVSNSLDIKNADKNETMMLKIVDAKNIIVSELDVDDDSKIKKSLGTGTLSSRKATVSSVGRRGDTRMHRAVAIRLADPDMSLLDALVAGGFEFPSLSNFLKEGSRMIYDSDNILLGQRKNQLNRRLRLAKEKNKKAGSIYFSTNDYDRGVKGNIPISVLSGGHMTTPSSVHTQKQTGLDTSAILSNGIRSEDSSDMNASMIIGFSVISSSDDANIDSVPV